MYSGLALVHWVYYEPSLEFGVIPIFLCQMYFQTIHQGFLLSHFHKGLRHTNDSDSTKILAFDLQAYYRKDQDAQ